MERDCGLGVENDMGVVGIFSFACNYSVKSVTKKSEKHAQFHL